MAENRRPSQRYLSGRVRVTAKAGLGTDRHLYLSPSDARLLIESFLFNIERRSLALLVVFQDLFNSLAFLILSVAVILFT